MTMRLTDPFQHAPAAHYAPLLRLLTPIARARVEARRPVCAGCSQNKGLGQVTVRCEATGCAGVSLIHGRCKRRNWPPPPEVATGTSPCFGKIGSRK